MRNNAIPAHLGKVTDAAQQTQGDAGRATRAFGELARSSTLNVVSSLISFSPTGKFEPT